MSTLGFWDILLWTVATYVAIVTLVRLMRRRRDQAIAQLQSQVRAEQVRQAAEQRKRKREEAKRQQIEQFRQRRPPAPPETPAETPDDSKPAAVSDPV